MEKKKAVNIAIVGVVIIIVVLSWVFIFKKKAPPPARPAVPVLAGTSVRKAMPVIIEAIGTVEAYNSISVQSRIVGQLKKIHFKEGQDVRKGDPLFTIDPDPYREKLKMAEAKLLKDKAQLKYNKDEEKRYAYLLEKGAVAKSDYENKQTIAGASQADVDSDIADVQNARLDLAYCFIASPINGRTGVYLVNEGTMVKDNDTKLTVVNQISPIYVKFSVPEKELPRIKEYMAKKALVVKAYPTGQKDKSAAGALTFVDNTVDTATGMITLKATYPNSDGFLWPGQFVNVVLELFVEEGAVVVPAAAVQVSQNGSYIFVIKPDKTVEYRIVTASRTIGDESVITSGVGPGETVVTDGQMKLNNGSLVEIVDGLLPGQAKGKNGKEGNTPVGKAGNGTDTKR